MIGILDFNNFPTEGSKQTYIKLSSVFVRHDAVFRDDRNRAMFFLDIPDLEEAKDDPDTEKKDEQSEDKA